MRAATWRIEEPDHVDSNLRGSPTGLVSLHFLRTALRRRWRLWAALALLGMALGLCFSLVVPATHSATSTLLLAHAPDADPAMEMATDVSLLRTRTVATQVIEELGLDVTPEDFQSAITVTIETSTVLVLSVAAPDAEAALARTQALTDAFLRFRTEQMNLQTDALVEGYQDRKEGLAKQAQTLTAQYHALSAGGPASQAQAAEVLTQRTQADTQISELQQSIEEARLASDAIIGASHVLDPASEVPQSSLRRLVLNTGSGLVVGGALGVGLVLFLALTSGNLRRREEVALALEAPVRHSVGKLPTGRGLAPRSDGGDREQSLRVLVHGLESTLAAGGGGPHRLVVGGVQNAASTRQLVATLGVELGTRGQRVFLVDLSESGDLEDAVARSWLESPTDDHSVRPLVHRPLTVPSLALGPLGKVQVARRGLPDGGPVHDAWKTADMVVTLADVDPAVGVDHLKTWSDRVVLLVSAGRSSAERLRTTGELIRAADLRLQFAMMTGADHHDESLGLAGVLDSAPPVRGQRR